MIVNKGPLANWFQVFDLRSCAKKNMYENFMNMDRHVLETRFFGSGDENTFLAFDSGKEGGGL